jgi:uncharacterized Zn-binding protein involved in type VI secretion
MPATVNCNMLTVVHAGSSGMAMSFPDVCKTPTPAGPIPIPYPNIAQSSDTADGSTTVKVDGNPIMLKSSNFRMSSGDEAGSAMGVVSNKIKGKAVPVNASFDVKVDGKAVFRLSDPMQTNCGSPGNALNAALLQPPQVVPPAMSPSCKEVNEKKKDQPESVAEKNSGMYPPHFSAIKTVAADLQVVLFFRQTNGLCIPWIAANHQPKPHRVFKGNTIKTAMVPEVDAWLKDFEAKLSKKGLSAVAAKARINAAAVPMATNAAYTTMASMYAGVVGDPAGENSAGQKMRKPLKAVGVGKQLSGNSYKGKWITGDYDLFQVLYCKEGCQEVNQKSRGFSRLKKAIAKACHWDPIQHGPQAQWVPTEEEKAKHGAPDVNFPKEVKSALQSKDFKRQVKIEGRNPMNIMDSNVTVIGPGGSVFLEKAEDTATALICSECDK